MSTGEHIPCLMSPSSTKPTEAWSWPSLLPATAHLGPKVPPRTSEPSPPLPCAPAGIITCPALRNPPSPEFQTQVK